MSYPTHCNPTGTALSSTSIPVPNVNASTVTIMDPGVGNRRGIIVFFRPTSPEPSTYPITPPPLPGAAYGQDTIAFATQVVADGWVFVYPACPDDFLPQYGSVNLLADYVDVKNDPGHGTFAVQTFCHWWDHLVIYLSRLYNNNNLPIITHGFSLGAHKSMLIAGNRSSTLIGAAAHCIPTIWENVGINIDGVDFATTNWSGYDLSATYLSSNNVTIPTVLGYATDDTSVGWDSAGTGGTPVSNIDAMITDAVNHGLPCTRYSSSTDASDGGHLFLGQDASFYASWVASNFDSKYQPSF